MEAATQFTSLVTGDRAWSPDTYLTDGTRLLRVVSQFVTPTGALTEVEDCRTLDVMALSSTDMARLRLRRVVPAA